MLIRVEEHRDARIATALLPLEETSGEAAYMAAYGHSEHVLIWINTKPRELYLADNGRNAALGRWSLKRSFPICLGRANKDGGHYDSYSALHFDLLLVSLPTIAVSRDRARRLIKTGKLAPVRALFCDSYFALHRVEVLRWQGNVRFSPVSRHRCSAQAHRCHGECDEPTKRPAIDLVVGRAAIARLLEMAWGKRCPTRERMIESSDEIILAQARSHTETGIS